MYLLILFSLVHLASGYVITDPEFDAWKDNGRSFLEEDMDVSSNYTFTFGTDKTELEYTEINLYKEEFATNTYSTVEYTDTQENSNPLEGEIASANNTMKITTEGVSDEVEEEKSTIEDEDENSFSVAEKSEGPFSATSNDEEKEYLKEDTEEYTDKTTDVLCVTDKVYDKKYSSQNAIESTYSQFPESIIEAATETYESFVSSKISESSENGNLVDAEAQNITETTKETDNVYERYTDSSTETTTNEIDYFSEINKNINRHFMKTAESVNELIECLELALESVIESLRDAVSKENVLNQAKYEIRNLLTAKTVEENKTGEIKGRRQRLMGNFI